MRTCEGAREADVRASARRGRELDTGGTREATWHRDLDGMLYAERQALHFGVGQLDVARG